MGRHGGINILHQKSWHVWRMDNQLRVERDELQHAELEKEKKRAEEKAAFDSKLVTLRRRASGKEDEPQELAAIPAATESRAATSTPASRNDGKSNKDGKKTKGDVYGKYGVELSNLKQAEDHLDQSLKSRFREQGDGYWGKGSLGSGPHINLFEEAEEECTRQGTDHQKLLRYTERNNELLSKSKKALFSDFDDITSVLPWYAQPRENLASALASAVPTTLVRVGKEEIARDTTLSNSRANQAHSREGRRTSRSRSRPKELSAGQRARLMANRSRSRSPPTRKVLGCKHGQVLVRARHSSRRCSVDVVSLLPTSQAEQCEGNFGAEVPGLKESKRGSKRERKARELEAMRRERDARERAERTRASNLLAGCVR